MAEPRTYARSFNTATAAAVRGGRIVKAGAEFAVSATNASRGQGLQGVRGHADAVVKYRNFKTEVGFTKDNALEARLYGLAGDTLTVTGLAMSAIALPKLASQAATSFQELKTLVRDPNADPEARLNAVEKLSRSSAGTVFAAQGVVVGTKGTYAILGRMPLFGNLFAKAGQSAPLMAVSKTFGKIFNVILPVADFAVLLGEGIALRRAFNDPTATGTAKFKAVVNFSLAGLKAAFWLFPQVRFLKTAYAFASFGQLSLALWELKATMAPHFKKAAENTLWAIGHPVEAVKAIGGKLRQAASWLGSSALKVGSTVVKAVLNPIDTVKAVTTELGAWSKAYTEGIQARTARAWYFLPWNQRPAGPAPLMPTPGALVPPPGATPAEVAPVAPAAFPAPVVDPAAQAPVAYPAPAALPYPAPAVDPMAQAPAMPPAAPSLPEAVPPAPPPPPPPPALPPVDAALPAAMPEATPAYAPAATPAYAPAAAPAFAPVEAAPLQPAAAPSAWQVNLG